MIETITVKTRTEMELSHYNNLDETQGGLTSEIVKRWRDEAKADLEWFNSDEPRTVWVMEWCQGYENVTLHDRRAVDAELEEYDDDEKPGVTEKVMTGREYGNLPVCDW